MCPVALGPGRPSAGVRGWFLFGRSQELVAVGRCRSDLLLVRLRTRDHRRPGPQPLSGPSAHTSRLRHPWPPRPLPPSGQEPHPSWACTGAPGVKPPAQSLPSPLLAGCVSSSAPPKCMWPRFRSRGAAGGSRLFTKTAVLGRTAVGDPPASFLRTQVPH